MREIKFRAWNKKLRVMSEAKTLDDLYDDKAMANVDDLEWLQFTGLQDKKGVDIYEGDILSHPDSEKFVVKWIQSYCAFRAVYGEEDKDNHDCSNLSMQTRPQAKSGIIGNIYENPELIEG